jgi:hypothetical protein
MSVLRRLCLAVVAALFLLPAVAANAATTTANVYVVPSGGSGTCARQATPVAFASAPASAKCSSFQSAVSAMAGGDTAIVKSGSYSNANVSNVTKSPGVRLVVESGGTANVGGTTWVGANGVTIDGTEGASGKGLSTNSGFTVGSNGGAAVKNFTLTGALIHDAGGGAVLYMTGCDNVNIRHLEIANITGADGIQMANFNGQPWCTNVVFDDVYMHDFNATCGVDHQDGVQVRSGANITFTNSKIVKLNNCGSQGFFANQEGDLGGNNTTLSNTVIAGINGNAINFSSKPPQRMINNTIDGGLNTCQPVTTTCNGVIMKNNIFNTSCAGLAIYHNRVQNSGDWANNVNTSSCGYSSQGDTVTTNFNAMFVSPGSPNYNYHLVSGAFPIGKANKTDFTKTDFEGGTRDSAPDAGVDEYGATAGTTPPPTTPPPTTPPATDTTAPNTTISAGPSGSSTATTASLSFAGTDNVTAVGSLKYECKLDSAAYAACTSPKAYSGVAVGSHTFSVRAKDAAGNVDASPATRSWTVTAPTTPPPATPSGPIGAWGFGTTTGTTATDASGHGLTGTISNATHTTSGKYGPALSFNGTSSLVSIPDYPKIDLTTGMTLEAWVRPSSLSGWRAVMMKEQSGDLVYGLYANTDTNRPSGYAYVSGAERDARGTAQLPLNTWSHLATTYDGITLRTYVNGVQVGSRAITGSIAVSTGALRIGGNTVWGEYFSGLIDEARLYNRALTATEIKSDMARPI